MTQIKMFMEKMSDMETFQLHINTFLKENEDKLIVKDIKYTADTPNPGKQVTKLWTAMVIYDERNNEITL